MKNYKEILEAVKEEVKKKLESEPSGHDYWHCYRVVKNAMTIGEREEADLQIVELAGWLHDIGIDAGKKGHAVKGAQEARKILGKLKVSENDIKKICDCIEKHSFYKGKKPESKEGQILQDADKLEALGAIGLIRLFVVAGHYGEKIFDPNIQPNYECYLKYGKSSSAINHFYDKIFKLKGLMHTKTARKIADVREKYMKEFLKRFYKEWEGKK